MKLLRFLFKASRRGRAVPDRRPSLRRKLHILGMTVFGTLERRLLLTTQTFTATVPTTLTDFTTSVSLPKFDPTLGVLNEVDLSFATNGQDTGTVTNNTPTAQTFSVSENIAITLGNGTNTLLTPTQTSSQTFTNLASGASASYGPFSPVSNASNAYTTGPDFTLFGSGPGNVTLNVATKTNQLIQGGGGNIAASTTTTAGGTVTVSYQYTVQPVSISGNVYVDQNQSGAIAPGDAPIPGTLLTLADSNGNTVATTTTGTNGTYTFTTTTAGTPITPGTYKVTETQPAGYLQGTNTVGTVNGVTDGVLIPVDMIGSIVLTSGQSSINNNFGELLPVTLSGNVYEDRNGTGVLSTGDAPIPGVTLTLTNGAGNVVATTTTGATGTYSFTTDAAGALLPPSVYKITETQPAGYLQGTNTVGTVNGATDGILIPVDMIGNIGLSQGQASINNNFGELLPVTVSGNVYQDVNGTGVLSTGDTPIPGTVLTLTNTAGNVVATTTTGATGTYSFTTTTAGTSITPGTYKVTETQPTGFLQGTNTVGTTNGATNGVLIPVDMIGSIVLASGQSSINNNFGELLPVAVSGNVYYDKNGTGSYTPGDLPIPGTVVTLSDANGNTVATTQTIADGSFNFSTTTAGAPIAPGTYKLTETQPVGYLQGTNTVGTTNGVTNGILIPVDMIGEIALRSGLTSINNNFGELLSPTPPVSPQLILTNTQRFGVHHQQTLIVLSFNTPLDPATANNAANYQVFGPLNGKNAATIPVTSATYDPTSNTVTLRLAQNLSIYQSYRLTINGLFNTSGNELQGNDGVPGSGYVTTISRTTLAGYTDHYGNFIPINQGVLYPAATVATNTYKPFQLPSNLGSFATVDEVSYQAATGSVVEGSTTLLKKPATVSTTAVTIGKASVRSTSAKTILKA